MTRFYSTALFLAALISCEGLLPLFFAPRARPFLPPRLPLLYLFFEATISSTALARYLFSSSPSRILQVTSMSWIFTLPSSVFSNKGFAAFSPCRRTQPSVCPLWKSMYAISASNFSKLSLISSLVHVVETPEKKNN